jgi:hypothetical protein
MDPFDRLDQVGEATEQLARHDLAGHEGIVFAQPAQTPIRSGGRAGSAR